HGFWAYARSFTYDSANLVTSFQLGNGHWESAIFNSRLQPIQIALGTLKNGTDLLRLQLDYGQSQNNGNLLSQTITVPSAGTASGFTALQSFTYDALDRIRSATETVSTTTWQQTFIYDRYGNRNFDPAGTTTVPTDCPTSVCNPVASAINNQYS